jgi:hypothetical protein
MAILNEIPPLPETHNKQNVKVEKKLPLPPEIRNRRNVKVEITLSNNTLLKGNLVVTGKEQLLDRLNKLTQVFKKELIVLSNNPTNYININKQHIIKVLEISDSEHELKYSLNTFVYLQPVQVKITLSNGEILNGDLLLKGEGRVSDRLNKIFGEDFMVFLDNEKQYYMLNKQHIITVEEIHPDFN